METKLLILGKGDNIITMILDNLYSTYKLKDIVVYNNLNLPILNPFDHQGFKIEVLNEVNIDDYNQYVLGVYQPQHKIKIVQTLNPAILKFTNVIHKGLDMSHTSKLGDGILINSKVSIAAHTTIVVPRTWIHNGANGMAMDRFSKAVFLFHDINVLDPMGECQT